MSVDAALRAMIVAVVREVLAEHKQPDAAPEYATVADYARRRQIAESTVRAAIRDGRLPALRIGRRAIRIPIAAEIGSLVNPARTADATARARLKLLGGGSVR
jgi:excisionase family DNA binding protein